MERNHLDIMEMMLMDAFVVLGNNQIMLNIESLFDIGMIYY
jgi:hypothetical protein